MSPPPLYIGDMSLVRQQVEPDSAKLQRRGLRPQLRPPVYHGDSLLTPAAVSQLQRFAGNSAVVLAVQARRKAPVRSKMRPIDPAQELVRTGLQLRTEALPAFEAAVDLGDPARIQEAGDLVMIVWASFESHHAALVRTEQTAGEAPLPSPGTPLGGIDLGLAPPPPRELPEFSATRETVVEALGMRRVAGVVHDGAPLASGPMGPAIARRVRDAADVARAAGDVALILELTDRPFEQDEKVVNLLRANVTPWRSDYLRGLLRAWGVEDQLRTLNERSRRAIGTIEGSVTSLKEDVRTRHADAVGMFELRPADGGVLVREPMTPEELAVELYGAKERWVDVLLPYNRRHLGSLDGGDLIPSGLLLQVEPGLLLPNHRNVFDMVKAAASSADRPRVVAQPESTAATGTSVRYTLDWPATPPVTVGDIVVRSSLRDSVDRVNADVFVQGDPDAVMANREAGERLVKSLTLTKAELGTEAATVDIPWPVEGTHVVHWRIYPEGTRHRPSGSDRMRSRSIVGRS